MRDTERQSISPPDETGVRLRREIFDEIAESKGAKTVAQQVALTGVSRPTLYRILAGHRPSLTNAMRIADALGVQMSVLFERVEDVA